MKVSNGDKQDVHTELAVLGHKFDSLKDNFETHAAVQKDMRDALIALVESNKEQERHSRQITELYSRVNNQETRVVTLENYDILVEKNFSKLDGIPAKIAKYDTIVKTITFLASVVTVETIALVYIILKNGLLT